MKYGMVRGAAPPQKSHCAKSAESAASGGQLHFREVRWFLIFPNWPATERYGLPQMPLSENSLREALAGKSCKKASVSWNSRIANKVHEEAYMSPGGCGGGYTPSGAAAAVEDLPEGGHPLRSSSSDPGHHTLHFVRKLVQGGPPTPQQQLNSMYHLWHFV
jgi:hypothetical protein